MTHNNSVIRVTRSEGNKYPNLSGLSAAVVAASETTDAAPAETAVGQTDLEEIVVTAQRRSKRLERTPVAVAVLSADELAQRNIVTETDLRIATPGLSVRALGSRIASQFGPSRPTSRMRSIMCTTSAGYRPAKYTRSM